MQIENRRRQLYIAGIFLFLLTMLYGTFFPKLPNPRMGLSGHLTGLFSALFLIGLGAMWTELTLGPKQEKAVFWLVLYGTYWNFVSNILGAVWATDRLTPLFGSKHFAEPWQENIVSFGFLSISLAMVIVCVLVLLGLYRHKEPPIA
jgi:hydroxylaminobenzene mutase